MLFLRIFQHLLPRAQAWRTTIDKQLRKLFEGLASEPAEAVLFADQVYLDLFPETTRELNEWERQYGLSVTDTTSPLSVAAGRLLLAAEWRATGGQSPGYLQGVLQTAGFDVYIHEWWETPGPPYVARDPRAYTTAPLTGTVQCTADGEPTQPQCSDLDTQHQCNDFLANDPGYLVNKDLTLRPPPPVPDDPNTWPFFFYVGAETFPDQAIVDVSRRDEFERLLLKLRPSHNWIVTRVTYTVLAGDSIAAEDGDFIITEDGDFIVAD
jgi:hypothetical protein